jgi:hypothetical protein
MYGRRRNLSFPRKLGVCFACQPDKEIGQSELLEFVLCVLLVGELGQGKLVLLDFSTFALE